MLLVVVGLVIVISEVRGKERRKINQNQIKSQQSTKKILKLKDHGNEYEMIKRGVKKSF